MPHKLCFSGFYVHIKLAGRETLSFEACLASEPLMFISIFVISVGCVGVRGLVIESDIRFGRGGVLCMFHNYARVWVSQ